MAHEIDQGQIPLGQSAEVYDAEILGATKGLAAEIRNPMARYAKNVTVCLDNEEAVIRLISEYPTATSSSQIERFRQLAKTWPHRELSLNFQQGLVSIRWCPSHSGIPGIEKADTLAKAACSGPPPNLPMTIARAKRKIKENYETYLVDYWNENAPARYKKLHIGPNSKITKELGFLTRQS